MLEENTRLIVAGASMLPLRPKTKRPFDDEWSTMPRQGLVALKKRFKDAAYNIGLRLGKWSKIGGNGYTHSFDVDVHDEPGEGEVWAELERRFGKIVHKLPMQKSGSAGASVHLIFNCESHFPSVNIAQSDRQVRRKNGKLGPAWSIDLFGTGKQVAMAPSIHPDTGNRYRWIRPIDPHNVPMIDAEVIRPFVFREEDDQFSDDAVGLSEEDVREYVSRLPDWHADDREKWIEAGMAIKHELGDAGLPIFVEFSKRNPAKYKREDEFGTAGPKVVKQQYKSIKNRETRGRLITMRTVIAAVHDYEHELSMRGIDDDFDDLPDSAVEDSTGPEPMRFSEILADFEDMDRADTDRDGASVEAPKARKGDPDLSILSFTREPAPSLDVDYIYGKSIARMIRAGATNAHCADDYVAAAVLAGASAAIGNSIKVELLPGFSQPLILWAMIIGLPSTKKTPALALIEKALNKIEASHMGVWRIAYERWQEDAEIAEGVLKDWKAKVKRARIDGEEPPARPANAEAPPMPPEPKIVSNNATIEAMMRLQERQPRGVALFAQELAQRFDDMSRYSNSSDRGYYLEGYDGGTLKVDRVKDNGKTLYVPRFAMPIIGGIQPDRLLSVTGHQQADDGFVPRFMPFWPETTIRDLNESAPPPDFEGLLRRLFEDIRMEDGEQGPEPTTIPLSAAARRHYIKWANQKNRDELQATSRLQSVFGKSDGLVGRLATILMLLEWAFGIDLDLPSEISLDYVKRAIFLRDSYIKPMQIRVWQHAMESKESQDARRIAEHIITEKLEDFSLRELRRESGIQGINSRTRAEDVEEAVSYLVSRGWCYPIEEDRRGTKGGRPTKRYGVNERIWELLKKPD